MSNLAVFYHACITGLRTPLDPKMSNEIMISQIQDMENSGLIDNISEFHVGAVGNEHDCIPAKLIAGKYAKFTCLGRQDGPLYVGELPTLGLLQDWIKTHPDWYVLYLHTKGVTKPRDPFRTMWRCCMMNVVVHHWEHCVNLLAQGYDMVGPHWLTNEKYPSKMLIGSVTPLWGGNFWWANTNYLLKLPPLSPYPIPEKQVDGWSAENWTGYGFPRVFDFAPHWPNINDCTNTCYAHF